MLFPTRLRKIHWCYGAKCLYATD